MIKIGIAFGAVFCFLLAFGSYIHLKRNFSNVFAAILLFAGAVVQICAYFNMAGIYFATSWLNYIYIPMLMIMGPATALHFFAHLDDSFKLKLWKLALFLPGLVVLALLPVLSYTSEVFDKVPTRYFSDGLIELPEYLLLLAIAHNSIFYIWIYLNTSLVFSYRDLPSRTSGRLFVAMFAMCLVLALMAGAAVIFRLEILLFTVVFLVAVLAALGFSFRQQYPNFYQDIKEMYRRGNTEQRYKNSGLAGFDLTELEERLSRLMDDEELYRDEELSLSSLAREVELKPYQLSEFLNSHLKTNFAGYVNTYRVKKAAGLLLDSGNGNILNIAFAVGFNSKATFNLAFKKVYEMSPREYIRTHARSA